jgi:hypothetical protein
MDSITFIRGTVSFVQDEKKPGNFAHYNYMYRGEIFTSQRILSISMN